jgi:hypothetical protein
MRDLSASNLGGSAARGEHPAALAALARLSEPFALAWLLGALLALGASAAQAQTDAGVGALEPSAPADGEAAVESADVDDGGVERDAAVRNEGAASPLDREAGEPVDPWGSSLSTPALLPPAAHDALVAPLIESAEQQPPRDIRSIPSADRPSAVIGLILGLLSLMALAYAGGHRRVIEWERRLGISQVITAGLPFILMGMIARLPSVGMLTDPVLMELSPLLRIGLGSVGFVAGFRFDAKLFQTLPRGTGAVAALSALVPAAVVLLATAPLLLLFSDDSWTGSVRNPVFLRDALILATVGAMTAPSALRLLDSAEMRPNVARVIRLEELAGVVGIAFTAAFFREHGAEMGWQLPGMGWLLLTLGLGTALGLLFYAILLVTPPGPDFLAVTLGAIAFAAGAAGYVHLSSVAVAFVAGVILANFPGTFQPRLHDMLARIERPIHLLSLFVIGALWNADDWRGWVLMPVFTVARLGGKWLAALIAARDDALPITAAESRMLAISPIGSLAIAIVVSAQLLYPGGSISLVVSAVIGGGVLTEAFVQLASRRAGELRREPTNGGPADRDAPVSARAEEGS